MLHVGVFILLLLSGERNFGVRLNKPFTQKIVFSDIPKSNGTHADLLFLVCISHRGADLLTWCSVSDLLTWCAVSDLNLVGS